MDQKDYDKIIPKVIEKPSLSNIKLISLVIIGLLFVGLGSWSVLVKIDAAAIAPGSLVVETKHQKIQHLEGGIIKKVHVKDGSVVNKGDVLIALDDTQASISLRLIQEQVIELLALEARLVAELEKKDSISYPKRLTELKHNPRVEHVLEGQRAIFTTNKKEYDGIINILNQRITQLEKIIDSLKAQIRSETEQLKYIDEELKAVEYLEKKKLIEKPRLLALKRARAKLLGDKGEHLGMVAKEQQKIGETRMQIININNTRRKEALKELRDTQKQLADLLNREKGAQDILDRINIKAPMAGVVLGLQKNTHGGVITPGQEVLSIVPQTKDLIIHARLSPLDIDVVHKGLKAKINLSSYKQRSAPNIEGTVEDVSADVFEDKQSKMSYYLVTIKLDDEEMQKLDKVKLYPGMPVEVMIVTDNRTPLSYLMSPIMDSFKRAFKEQ